MKVLKNKIFQTIIAIILCFFCSFSVVGCVGAVGGGSSSGGGSGSSGSPGSSSGNNDKKDPNDSKSDSDATKSDEEFSKYFYGLMTVSGLDSDDALLKKAYYDDYYKESDVTGGAVTFNYLFQRQCTFMACYLRSTLNRIYGIDYAHALPSGGVSEEEGKRLMNQYLDRATSKLITSDNFSKSISFKYEDALGGSNNTINGFSVTDILDNTDKEQTEGSEESEENNGVEERHRVKAVNWSIASTGTSRYTEYMQNVSAFSHWIKCVCYEMYTNSNAPRNLPNFYNSFTWGNSTLQSFCAGNAIGQTEGTISEQLIKQATVRDLNLGITNDLLWYIAYYIKADLVGETEWKSNETYYTGVIKTIVGNMAGLYIPNGGTALLNSLKSEAQKYFNKTQTETTMFPAIKPYIYTFYEKLSAFADKCEPNVDYSKIDFSKDDWEEQIPSTELATARRDLREIIFLPKTIVYDGNGNPVKQNGIIQESQFYVQTMFLGLQGSTGGNLEAQTVGFTCDMYFDNGYEYTNKTMQLDDCPPEEPQRKDYDSKEDYEADYEAYEEALAVYVQLCKGNDLIITNSYNFDENILLANIYEDVLNNPNDYSSDITGYRMLDGTGALMTLDEARTNLAFKTVKFKGNVTYDDFIAKSFRTKIEKVKTAFKGHTDYEETMDISYRILSVYNNLFDADGSYIFSKNYMRFCLTPPEGDHVKELYVMDFNPDISETLGKTTTSK